MVGSNSGSWGLSPRARIFDLEALHHEFCILEVNIRYLRNPAGDLNRRGWAGRAPTGIASEKDRSASQSREREIGFTRSKRRFTELATKGNAPIPEVLDGCIRRLPTPKDSRRRHSKSPTEKNAIFTIFKYHFTIGILVRSIVMATAPIRTAPNTMF